MWKLLLNAWIYLNIRSMLDKIELKQLISTLFFKFGGLSATLVNTSYM